MDHEQLTAALVAGEETAWRRFIRDYGSVIFAVATKLGLRGPERDDLFQEACLSAVRSIHTLRDPSRISAWVYTIAYRAGIDSMRRKRPEVQVEEPGELSNTARPTYQEPTVIQELERLEEAVQLRDALEQLDRRCRRLLTALFLDEPRLSYAELARREALPVGSIGPNRARCLERLAKLLKNLSNNGHDPST